MKRGKSSRQDLLGPHVKEIIKLYNNRATLGDIAEIYNVANATVSAFLKDNGIEVRKPHGTTCYTINDAVFENIDSQEKAWVLGFLYADGCIS